MMILCENERATVMGAFTGLADGFLAPKRAFISENCFWVTPTGLTVPKQSPMQKRKIRRWEEPKFRPWAFFGQKLGMRGPDDLDESVF